MHQDAFPGEDVSDRPDPTTVVPVLLALVEQRPPSGATAPRTSRHRPGRGRPGDPVTRLEERPTTRFPVSAAATAPTPRAR